MKQCHNILIQPVYGKQRVSQWKTKEADSWYTYGFIKNFADYNMEMLCWWNWACEVDTYPVGSNSSFYSETVKLIIYWTKNKTEVEEYTLLITFKNKMNRVTNQVVLCKLYVMMFSDS